MEHFGSAPNKNLLWDLIAKSRPYGDLDRARAEATRAHFERTFENMADAPDPSVVETNKRLLVNVVGFMSASASVPTPMLERIQNFAAPNKGEIDFTALPPINQNIPPPLDLQPVSVLLETAAQERDALPPPAGASSAPALHALAEIAKRQEEILEEVREIRRMLSK